MFHIEHATERMHYANIKAETTLKKSQVWFQNRERETLILYPKEIIVVEQNGQKMLKEENLKGGGGGGYRKVRENTYAYFLNTQHNLKN